MGKKRGQVRRTGGVEWGEGGRENRNLKSWEIYIEMGLAGRYVNGG